MIVIARVLDAGRVATAAVARREGAIITFATLERDVAALLAQLRERPKRRWLVYCEDSYAFAVAVLAVLHAGSSVVLPPNGQRGTIADLSADAPGLLTDCPGMSHEAALAPLGHPEVAPQPWRALDADEARIEVLTSGTTGERKVVSKRLAQLDAELVVLEATFGALLAGTTIAASVSHQHIYGLLFRVLWPLAAGRPFVAETPVHPEELVAGMDGARTWALISSPVHLRLMTDLLGRGDWTRRCRFVTSSGAPLDQPTAHAWAAGVGSAPLEVLGSTETGGVAWRRQTPGITTCTWTPLSGVRLSVSQDAGPLRVHSPFVGTDAGPNGAAMGDAARMLDDGRFHLLGRLDRIVKVGGKRLSLADMEQWLTEHPAVLEAGIVQLDDQLQGRTAAVVVLSETGRQDVKLSGRRRFHNHLREHLLDRFDPITIPRTWQHVGALPADATGKVTQAGLRALFVTSRAGDRLAPSTIGGAWLPRLLRRAHSENACEWSLVVPKELPILAGHFPGDPIVPGVAQIAWVMEAAADLFGSRRTPLRFEAVKFRAVIRPDTILTLRVERTSTPHRVEYRLVAADTIHASGRIIFAPSEVSP